MQRKSFTYIRAAEVQPMRTGRRWLAYIYGGPKRHKTGKEFNETLSKLSFTYVIMRHLMFGLGYSGPHNWEVFVGRPARTRKIACLHEHCEAATRHAAETCALATRRAHLVIRTPFRLCSSHLWPGSPFHSCRFARRIGVPLTYRRAHSILIEDR